MNQNKQSKATAPEKITVTNRILNVPDHPIIPYITGDGIGEDITPVMIKVVDTSVEIAYKGKRKIEWLKAWAGDEAVAKKA